MTYRPLSSQEQQDAMDFFFNLGIDAKDAGARLALINKMALRDERPVFDVISQMKLEGDIH